MPVIRTSLALAVLTAPAALTLAAPALAAAPTPSATSTASPTATRPPVVAPVAPSRSAPVSSAPVSSAPVSTAAPTAIEVPAGNARVPGSASGPDAALVDVGVALLVLGLAGGGALVVRARRT